MRQKLAGAGLLATALFGIGAAGNAYLTGTAIKPAKESPAPKHEAFASVSRGPGGVATRQARQSKAKYRPAYGSIDLNTATLEELEDLPGVGPATAKKIVEYRTASGGFRTIDELDNVKGIGPKKLEEIRPYCRL